MNGEKEILALNAFDRSSPSAMDAALQDAVERRLRSFGAASVLFYQEPLRMERAEGVWMFDAEGRSYLDLYNNVPSVGHSHPRVVEAIRRQVGLLNTHTRYLNDVVDSYAERLLATFPSEIDHLVLTCTGSEANDLALRIAKETTGRSRLHRHGNGLSRQHRRGDGCFAVGSSGAALASPRPCRSGAGDVSRLYRRSRPAFCRPCWSRHCGSGAERLRSCGADGRYDLFERWGLCRSAGLPGARRQTRSRTSGPVHCRRGPAGLRANRSRAVGICPAWRGAGYCHHGKAHG